MTVISEGLLLNSKYINMGREERVFKLSSQPPLVKFTMRLIKRLSNYGFATVRRA